jgi:hypothetical protein
LIVRFPIDQGMIRLYTGITLYGVPHRQEEGE